MNEILRRSCNSIFLEVARFFLRYGVTYQEMRDTLKNAVVEAAITDLPSENTPISNASIAEKIGLSRRAVAEVRSKPIVSKLRTESAVPAGVMLKIWHNDPRYLDDKGRPKELDISGGHSHVSMQSLSEDADCSVTVDNVIDSLTNAGAIEVRDGKARVKARTFIMNPSDESTAMYFGIAGSNLLSTLVHNTGDDFDAPFFERTTWVSGINRAVFPRFSELVSETSIPFLELLDDWLTHRQGQLGDGQQENSDGEVLGVGIYVFNRGENVD